MESDIIKFGNFFHQNKFYSLILTWFKKNQRDLYWRNNRSLYLTYLTEIMLQQTTVNTVENKLNSYLKKFPNFKSYKHKSMNDLLRNWSGLGFYNRAENLYKSIKIINSEYGGSLPSNKNELLNLPGVGEYTANAIIAIGYNRKAFPVDVNVRRLISRLIKKSYKDKDIEEILKSTFKNRINYRNFSESLMDFSSIICKKKYPLCKGCTFNSFCKSAFSNFNQSNKVKINKKSINFYLFKQEDKICFIKNPNFKFYKKFLHLPSNLDKEFLSKINLADKVAFKSFNYSITNNQYKVKAYSLDQSQISDNNCIWIKKTDLNSTALPTLFKKILN